MLMFKTNKMESLSLPSLLQPSLVFYHYVYSCSKNSGILMLKTNKLERLSLLSLLQQSLMFQQYAGILVLKNSTMLMLMRNKLECLSLSRLPQPSLMFQFKAGTLFANTILGLKGCQRAGALSVPKCPQGRVVKHSTPNPNIKGLDPANCTRRAKIVMVKSYTLGCSINKI